MYFLSFTSVSLYGAPHPRLLLDKMHNNLIVRFPQYSIFPLNSKGKLSYCSEHVPRLLIRKGLGEIVLIRYYTHITTTTQMVYELNHPVVLNIFNIIIEVILSLEKII